MNAVAGAGVAIPNDSEPLEDNVLLEEMVMAIVSHPEDVIVTVPEGRVRRTLVLNVHPDDRGRVIGKMGHTIDMIRTFISTVGAQHGYSVDVELIEPNKPGGVWKFQRRPFNGKQRPNQNGSRTV